MASWLQTFLERTIHPKKNHNSTPLYQSLILLKMKILQNARYVRKYILKNGVQQPFVNYVPNRVLK